jgi:hypothetical protein
MVDFSVAGKKKTVEEIKPEEAPDPGKQLATVFKSAFDIEPLRVRFAPYREILDKILKEAKDLEVKDDESNKQAVAIGTSSKKLAKEIEGKKKEITAPYRGFTQAVNSFADEFLDRLSAIETDLKKKITVYAVSQEQKKREEMLAQQKAREELQKKLDAQAKKSGTEPVVLPEVTQPALKQPTRSETGTAYQREYLAFELTDIKLVPTEYLAVSHTKVREAIDKRGIREIPGLRIYPDPRTSFRTS